MSDDEEDFTPEAREKGVVIVAKEDEPKESKDSLFSSEESEDRFVKVLTPEPEDISPEEEYSEEDLEKLVSYIKDITTLYDLRPEDWTEECYQNIRYWLTEPAEPLLIIYFDEDELTCDTCAPRNSIIDATYFLREIGYLFEPNTFYDNIIFGTIGGSIEGSVLQIIQNAYAPVLLRSKNWPDSVKNDFNNSLHMFLAKITDLHYKLQGLTVLYVPRIISLISVEDASEDKELIKRMEGVVVYWTKQVRVGLQDQDQSASEDMLCPIDEYDFWKYRYENLLGLNYQLDNPGIKHICNILTAVQSPYVRQFRFLAEEIIHNVEEAKSNIEYLNVLMEPCNQLSEMKHPDDFPPILPKILNLIRFIWMRSPYYNTQEKITILCRSLSNQIILQCTKFIEMDVIFEKKETRNAIKMFETCIQCLMDYIKAYILVQDSHNEFGESPWDLDRAPIFNHVDSYIQRCKDMIEVCEAMIVFGRHDETEEIPKPLFGTSKGLQFESWAERIEKMFQDSLNDIQNVNFRILDVQQAEWYDDILKFRTRMKDIEVVVENLTNAVFDEIANVEEGIESLAAMYNYSKRKTLFSLFDGKTLQVYKMFREEILDTKQDIQTEAEMYSTIMPYYSGRAKMLKMKYHRLKVLKQMFDDAGWMKPCSIAKDVFAQYEKLIASIDDKIFNLYRKWVDSIGEDVSQRLQRPLMNKSISHPGLLECNIDRSLLDIFKESKYWDAMHYEIPTYVKSLCMKAENVRFIFECVLNVVLDYNKIISALSDEERLLFKPLISNVEKKIAPGLTKLTWATDIGDEYIAECSNNTAELQDFVDDYKQCNLQIVLICEKICDTPLIRLTQYAAMDLQELVDELSRKMNNTLTDLIAAYHKIMELLVMVFEGFENVMGSMAAQWVRYIYNFDKLMEEALKICCKNSLQSMFEALHGDGTTEPVPLIQIEVNLIGNKINFIPTLVNVARVISNVQNTLVEAVKALPRLNDKFHVSDSDYTPYADLIHNDIDCRHMQNQLNNEVRVAVEKIKDYIKVWEPFRDLWEVDKDKFIQRYELENPSAALFDANIGRYTELANNVQIQETVSDVHFLQINCSELKKAIIEHCIEWQSKLCLLLYSLTEKKIDDIYNYMDSNAKEILREPENLDHMQFSIQLYAQLRAEITFQEEQFPQISDQIYTLDKYSVPIPHSMRARAKHLPKEWIVYLESLDQAEHMLEYSKEHFKNHLLEQAEGSRQNAKHLLDEFLVKGPFTSDWSVEDGLAYLKGIRVCLEEMKERDDKLRGDLAIFGLSYDESVDLSKLENELASIELVWELAAQWEAAWNSYKSGEFWTIETAEMEELAQVLFRKLTRLSRELAEKNWKIVEDVRGQVDAFRRTLPLLGDLKNPAMRPRHWERVKKAVGIEFDETSPEFNLEAIYAMELHKFAEDINEISNAATMELQIEKGLRAIVEVWTSMQIEIVPYRERSVYRIKSVDDCFAALEENIMQLSQMKSTRFVEPFSKIVDYWERTLSYIMETLEIGLQVQRQWLYLENIFFGEDIRKQLPKESEDFDHLTEDWREISTRLYFSKSALRATHYKPPPYLFNKLNKMNDKLDLMQRALERYLETKRHIFPRFYFISNDDMLEILGNSKKPEAVQPHLKKLFDNLNKIKIQKNTGINKQECTGMFSDDGEFIEFIKPFILDGPAEMWLTNLESSMH